MIGQARHRSLHESNRAAGFSLRGRPRGPRPAARAAFSLAEMMIALIILGFGLMVVGAALPVGLSYTQKNVNRATGDAAAEYALDLIEQNIRTSQDPWNEILGQPWHTADIFQPRYGPGEPNGGTLARVNPADPNSRLWEPLIKVRPLLPVSIDTTPGTTFGGESPTPHGDVEERIFRWLSGFGVAVERREFDALAGVDPPPWVQPALPSVASVYPPVSSDAPFSVYGQNGYFGQEYLPRPATCAELLKATERRTTWTAFYRRVSYAQDSDPNLYEVIVVATRLASDAHRFPRFDPSLSVAPTGDGGGGPIGEAVGYGAGDTLAPVPWLVVFKNLPALPDCDLMAPGRPIMPGAAEAPTLQFLAYADTGPLLPAGSIFIPAVNDHMPTQLAGSQWAGFVPHAPDVLPIYEVIDRIANADGTFNIIVKNNGFYPWIATGATNLNWPVWVIPPAFKELDGGGNPIYEDSSPIVAVARRIIRFRELP